MTNLNPNFNSLNAGSLRGLNNKTLKPLKDKGTIVENPTGGINGVTETENTKTQPMKAPYKNGAWGAVKNDIENGRLKAGDHINMQRNGKLYRFQVIETSPGKFTCVQTAFANGNMTVKY